MLTISKKAEDVFIIIANLYDGNIRCRVLVGLNAFPEYTVRKIEEIFNELKDHNLITTSSLTPSTWAVTLTPTGISFVDSAKRMNIIFKANEVKDNLTKSMHSTTKITETDKISASTRKREELKAATAPKIEPGTTVNSKIVHNAVDMSATISKSENSEIPISKDKNPIRQFIEVPSNNTRELFLKSDSFSSLGLFDFEKRTYSKLNLVIGENGSGKSRFLQAARNSLLTSSEVNVIYMDFSAVKPNMQFDSAKPQKVNADKKNEKELNISQEPEDQPLLSDAIVFKDSLPQDAYANFVPFVEDNCNSLFDYLWDNWQIKRLKKKMEVRLNAINDHLLSFLKRQVLILEDGCYITDRENTNESKKLNQAILQMSPGERVILYFALGILAISIDNNDYVLLIDEPETHLHPKALVGIIKAVKNDLNPACAFIATHSIFLIPQFTFEQTIFLEKSCVKKLNSKMYKEIYESLVGDDDHENQTLHTFLSSIYDWQYAGFLAECFLDPTTIDCPNMNDPQYRKLRKILTEYDHGNNDKIHLLDYGSGSGRIAKCFNLSSRKDSSDTVCEHLIYSIYDKYSIADDLPTEKWMGRIYSSFDELQKAKNKFEIIVLFNVLHEISIDDWVSEINQMISMLSPDGIIVFGERTELSKGENPFGKSGYLVMNKNDLQLLFGKRNVSEMKLAGVDKDPTSCFIIAPVNGPITIKHVTDALTSLKDTTYKTIRGFKTAKANGRSYAFYCQQYINALQALDIIRPHENVPIA